MVVARPQGLVPPCDMDELFATGQIFSESLFCLLFYFQKHLNENYTWQYNFINMNPTHMSPFFVQKHLQKHDFSTKNGLISVGLKSIKWLNKERQPLEDFFIFVFALELPESISSFFMSVIGWEKLSQSQIAQNFVICFCCVLVKKIKQISM